MSLELLYTSAPQGLKQGSRGFCTVISTAGMPINIAQKLESLSGYRHLYPPNDPQSNRNPVAYSHFRFQVGGRTVSLLSRIADYGLDYSQRTNKIAHHIVAETTAACGPAALMASPGVMRTQWDGQCETLATGPDLPQLASSPEVCESWERIAGDAGWGGVVANAWMQPSNKPTWIVFSEDQSSQLLNLIAEAIAILPPSKRWQATFSTYVTTLPPDIDCRVRCVVAGSEEARMAAARGTVIDLTKPLGPPAAGVHVQAARNGTLIGLPGASAKLPPGIPTSINLADQRVDESESSEYANSDSNDDFDVDNPFGTLDRTPPDISARPYKSQSARREWEADASNKPRRSKSTLYVIAGVIGILFGLLCVGGTYVYLQTKQLSELVTEETQLQVEPEQNRGSANIEHDSSNVREALAPESQAEPETNTSTLIPPPQEISPNPLPLPPTPQDTTAPMESAKKLEVDMLRIQANVSLESLALEHHIPGSVITASVECISQDPEIIKIFEQASERIWIWQKSSDGTNWTTIKESEQNSYTVTEKDHKESLRCIMQIADGPEKTLDSPVQPTKPAILRVPISEIGRMRSLTTERTRVTCSLQIPFIPAKEHEFTYQETKVYTTKYDKTTKVLFIIGCDFGQLLSGRTWDNLNNKIETILSQRKQFAEKKNQILNELNSNPSIRENTVFTKLKKELRETDDCHDFVQNISIRQWIDLADIMVEFHEKKNTFTPDVLEQKQSDINFKLQKLNIQSNNIRSDSEQVASIWKQAKNPKINPSGSPLNLVLSMANTCIDTENDLLDKPMNGDSRGKLFISKFIKEKFAGDSEKEILVEFQFPLEIHFYDTETKGDHGGSRKQDRPSKAPMPPMQNLEPSKVVPVG